MNKELIVYGIGIFAVSVIMLLPLLFASPALTDGLVAYYSFDVGMNTTDSLYSKNLTNYGVTWNAAGKIGEAGDYEKDNAEYALTPNMGDLSAMTLCLWLKQETTSGSRRAFFGRFAPDPHMYGDLYENNQIHVAGGHSQDFMTGIYVAANTNWHFVCYIGDSSGIGVYVNGTWTSKTTDKVVLVNTNPTFEIGRYAASYQNYMGWDGLIDEVGIWNRILTSDEIEALYNSGDGLAYPFAPADTCTCAGAGNDWEIDMSDYCNITDACDLTTGTLSFTGAGITRINSEIHTTNLGDPGATGILKILSNALIWIKGI